MIGIKQAKNRMNERNKQTKQRKEGKKERSLMQTGTSSSEFAHLFFCQIITEKLGRSCLVPENFSTFFSTCKTPIRERSGGFLAPPAARERQSFSPAQIIRPNLPTQQSVSWNLVPQIHTDSVSPASISRAVTDGFTQTCPIFWFGEQDDCSSIDVCSASHFKGRPRMPSPGTLTCTHTRTRTHTQTPLSLFS